MEQLPQPIENTPDYLRRLRGLAHSESLLQWRGYPVRPLSAQEIWDKRRCGRCCRKLSNDRKRARGGCTYHPGQVQGKWWNCCKKPAHAGGCCYDEDHEPYQWTEGALEAEWRYYHTPVYSNTNRPSSSSAHQQQEHVAAVAFDCEMGVGANGENELIHLSVVDYFTGETLIDKLVWPDVKMRHFNTRHSGVTSRAMHQARKQRTCIFGRKKARKEVWKYVGPETVVVGHAGSSDFDSLRWIHPLVVDTQIIEQEAVERAKERLQEAEYHGQTEGLEELKDAAKSVGLGLASIAGARLGRAIQVERHNAAEDAMATRDVLHWHMVNRSLDMARPGGEVVDVALSVRMADLNV